MKTVEQYQCEICKSIHDTSAKAEKCEASHYDIKKIEPVFMANHKYPHQVRITYKIGDKQQVKTCAISSMGYSRW